MIYTYCSAIQINENDTSICQSLQSDGYRLCISLINKTLFLFMYLKRDNYFGLLFIMNEILLHFLFLFVAKFVWISFCVIRVHYTLNYKSKSIRKFSWSFESFFKVPQVIWRLVTSFSGMTDHSKVTHWSTTKKEDLLSRNMCAPHLSPAIFSRSKFFRVFFPGQFFFPREE